jgi:hypothetical protein
MWRTTVMHRQELADPDAAAHLPAPYPAAVDASEVQSVDDGVGPLFHRRYSARITGAELDPEALMGVVQLHMWISFLEGAAKLAQGSIDSDGIEIDTRRVDAFGAP